MLVILQVVFGFSQTIFKNGNAIKCIRLCPKGQHLLETDSQGLEKMLPSFIKFDGMEEPNRPGAIWYLTLMAAAILDVEPLELVEQHKKTMARPEQIKTVTCLQAKSYFCLSANT